MKVARSYFCCRDHWSQKPSLQTQECGNVVTSCLSIKHFETTPRMKWTQSATIGATLWSPLYFAGQQRSTKSKFTASSPFNIASGKKWVLIIDTNIPYFLWRQLPAHFKSLTTAVLRPARPGAEVSAPRGVPLPSQRGPAEGAVLPPRALLGLRSARPLLSVTSLRRELIGSVCN